MNNSSSCESNQIQQNKDIPAKLNEPTLIKPKKQLNISSFMLKRKDAPSDSSNDNGMTDKDLGHLKKKLKPNELNEVKFIEEVQLESSQHSNKINKHIIKIDIERNVSQSKNVQQELCNSEDIESADDKEIVPEHLRNKYLKTYKFLKFDSETNKICCSWCHKRGFINALSKGKKYLFDKTIMQHIPISEHVLSSELEFGPSQTEKGQQTLDAMLNSRENIAHKEFIPLFKNFFSWPKRTLL